MSDRYRELRKQLAELGSSFNRASEKLPSSFYEFIEADSPMSRGEWRRWIDDNRTGDDLQRERWDIYPAGWSLDQDLSEIVEPDRTRICGVLHSQPATIDAAESELKHLANTGIKILLAIRDEVKLSPGLDNLTDVPKPLPEGHRGWLDLVRNSAETNRGTSLMVEYRLFPSDHDRQSQLKFMVKSLTASRKNHPFDGFNSCRVTPDIFAVSANAIIIWLEGTQEEPIVPLVCPGLTIPKLLSPDDRDDALEILRGTNSRTNQSLAVPPARSRKPKRGRPPRNEATKARDQKVYQQSRDGIPRKEIARRFNLSLEDVAKGIDAERKAKERKSAGRN